MPLKVQMVLDPVGHKVPHSMFILAFVIWKSGEAWHKWHVDYIIKWKVAVYQIIYSMILCMWCFMYLKYFLKYHLWLRTRMKIITILIQYKSELLLLQITFFFSTVKAIGQRTRIWFTVNYEHCTITHQENSDWKKVLIY